MMSSHLIKKYLVKIKPVIYQDIVFVAIKNEKEVVSFVHT